MWKRERQSEKVSKRKYYEKGQAMERAREKVRKRE